MEVVNKFIGSMIPMHIVYDIKRWAGLICSTKLWLWLVVGALLTFVGMVIMLCKPLSLKKIEQQSPKPVTSEEIFDRVLELEIPIRSDGSEIQFSARA